MKIDRMKRKAAGVVVGTFTVETRVDKKGVAKVFLIIHNGSETVAQALDDKQGTLYIGLFDMVKSILERKCKV